MAALNPTAPHPPHLPGRARPGPLPGGPGPGPAHLGDAIACFPAAQVGSHPAIARWYAHLVATAPREAGAEGLLPAGRLTCPRWCCPSPRHLRRPPPPRTRRRVRRRPRPGAPAGAAGAGAAAAPAPRCRCGRRPEEDKAKAGKDGPQGGGGGEAKPAGAAAAAAPAPAAAAAAAAPTSSSPEDAAIAGLDFRVGRILKAERHPNPEVTSLYVETIDLGEPAGPRTVVSGLARYLPLEALADRLVVIVANLKPAKMKDVLSAGMVLCASAGEVCDPIDPPAGVAVGERVVFEGHAGPAEPVHKKVAKLFDAAAPHLKVGEDGVCRFKGVAFGTSAGPVTSKVAGGMIK